MPEENSEDVEKLTFVDDKGRIYLGARMVNPDYGKMLSLCRDLSGRLNGSSPQLSLDGLMAGIVRFDGGKHANSVYCVYDPYEHLICMPTVGERYWV